jgi:hypothetical protein
MGLVGSWSREGSEHEAWARTNRQATVADEMIWAWLKIQNDVDSTKARSV